MFPHVTRFGAAAALLAAARLSAQAAGAAAAPAPIGPDAVWAPPADFRARFHEACDPAGPGMGACFLRQMQAAGASPAAVEFARRTGEQGYLTRFRDTGVVDVAYAEYPFRANENQVVLLVNGEPPMLDVDDTSSIGQPALDANPTYAGMKKSFPKIALFPGDRSDGQLPRALERRRAGGQRFVVVYELRDGCHACQVLGYARIGLDFDAQGRFAGAEVEQVRPQHAPGSAKQPKKP